MMLGSNRSGEKEFLMVKKSVRRTRRTHNPMARGFVYLTGVVDVASRRVLAHKVAITLEACHGGDRCGLCPLRHA